MSDSWRAARHAPSAGPRRRAARSEEHTSELQSRLHLVCRLLLEKKNTYHSPSRYSPSKGRIRLLAHDIFTVGGTSPNTRRNDPLSKNHCVSITPHTSPRRSHHHE